jgi:hypothetical protein
MFKRVNVPLRSFYCELKYRSPDDVDGSREELIETLIYKVPRLANSDMEKQWCFSALWNKICEEDWKSRGINQVFIFTAQFGELLMRMELNEFVDEKARKLEPPDENAFKKWQDQVEKQFRKIHGISVNEWRNNGS